jgi:hypothetical protein
MCQVAMFHQLFPAKEKQAELLLTLHHDPVFHDTGHVFLHQNTQSRSGADVFKDYFPTTKDGQRMKLTDYLQVGLWLRMHGA